MTLPVTTDIISDRHTVTVTPANDSVTVAVSGSDLEESFHGVDVIDVETYFQVSPRGEGALRRFSIDGTGQQTVSVASGYVGFYMVARLRDSDRRVVDFFISGHSLVLCALTGCPAKAQRRENLPPALANLYGLAPSVKNHTPGGYRLPSQSSKTVLSTVHVGGPKGTVDGTIFEMWLGNLSTHQGLSTSIVGSRR